jgi:crossover junction endodeoxyribonuclease RusA
MWKHTKTGNHYLQKKARDYYEAVAWIVRTEGKLLNIDYPVVVQCVLFPPDKRRRDMDNAWKVIGDALTKSTLWQDDHLIRRLTLEWSDPVKDGRVMVLVSPL